MCAVLDRESAIEDVAFNMAIGLQAYGVRLNAADQASAYGDIRGIHISLNVAIDLNGALRCHIALNEKLFIKHG